MVRVVARAKLAVEARGEHLGLVTDIVNACATQAEAEQLAADAGH